MATSHTRAVQARQSLPSVTESRYWPGRGLDSADSSDDVGVFSGGVDVEDEVRLAGTGGAGREEVSNIGWIDPSEAGAPWTGAKSLPTTGPA